MNKLLIEHKKILSEGLQFHLIENIGIENNIYRLAPLNTSVCLEK
jgi:hypothetical protein